MYRFALDYLKDWASRTARKPLVLRGARQVGKSYLVRMLAREVFDSIAEINFEQLPDAADLFKSKQTGRIVPLLETRLEQSIVPGKTLLFLDEIQAAPEVFASLRYFHEEMPQLHMIAAGSLLEFMLKDHAFSMPVGRIEYMHLGPMTFSEFLLALGRDKLLDYLRNYSLSETLPDSLHAELMHHLRDYSVVGGMPEAIDAFARTNSYMESERVLNSILSTYRDDFNKYGTKVDRSRIEKIFSNAPHLIGQKFKYTQVYREERSRDLKNALLLLEGARVVYRALHSDANGVPLGAETNDRHFKTIFLDVGLVCRMCGLTLRDIRSAEDVMLVNSGAISEQLVAQHLLYSGNYDESPQLFCWLRQRGSSSAEVDYLFSMGANIVPVEVKAGKSGSLRSLQVFLHEKKRSFALRFNTGLPSVLDTVTSIAGKKDQPFRLLSLPLYLVDETRRLCREAMGYSSD